MTDKERAFKRLKDRLALISRGICLEPISKDKPVVHLQSYYGGTGPRGKVYYVCYPNDTELKSMISLPIYPNNHYLAKYAIQTKRSETNPHDLITEDGIILKGIPPAKKPSKTQSGIAVGLIISNHPYDTRTVNVSSSCRHFENDEKCKFCTTDLAMETLKMPKRLDHQEVLEAIKLNIEASPNMRTITVSGGTIDDPDINLEYMVELAKKIKTEYEYPLFFQIEPCSDMAQLEELSKYSEGIAVCLDVFDERVRQEICPGKAKTPKEKYYEMWEACVKFFGKGNVESHCIIGLGEDLEEVLQTIERCASIGVRVTPLQVRAGSKALPEDFVPSYLEKEQEYLDFHIRVAKIMQKYGICYKHKEGSGCIGCKGCNAIVEACDYVSMFLSD